ncbi:CsbD family protein [Limosilactobacillus pontis]|uniref:CsbD family protein n=2 Tax=Limosilactobacillus pontis TaxID=35787 RepID=A0A2J6NP59_9LACO|nr:CsbD family protein [Limosilactobacillus pontis]
MERLMCMVSDKHGLKDRVVGTFKELKGKATNDKTEEMVGKLRKAKGKIKDKARDLKDDLDKKKKEA